MLNEVKHLYNKDSSLTLRMTVSVIIYIVTLFYIIGNRTACIYIYI